MRGVVSLLCVLGAWSGCRRSSPQVAPPSTHTAVSHGDASTAAPDAAVRPPPVPDPPPRAGPPTMFRLDPGHTGRSPYRLPQHPRITRRLEAAARISTQAVALPDGGVAFTAHDGLVRAFDLDGHPRWELATGDRIYTTPLVTADGAMFFGTDADRFVSLDPRGRLRVALATPDDADTSPVMCADGSLRFASGRTLFAVASDLTVRWRLRVGGKIFSSPAVTDDCAAVFGAQDNRVYAVGPEGVVRWQFDAGDDVDAPPTLDHLGNVYVGGDDGHVFALRPDGTERWRHAVGGYVRAGVALGARDTLIVPTYGPRTRVLALDRATGDERWSYDIDGPPTAEYGVASAPLVDARGDIAVGGPDDALHLLRADGSRMARVPLPADVDGAPVLLSEGVLAVGCDDGVMYLLGDANADDAGAGPR